MTMTSKEKRIQRDIALIKIYKDAFFEEEKLYKEKHPNWNELPDREKSNIHRVFFLRPAILDVRQGPVMGFYSASFNRFEDDYICVRYYFLEKSNLPTNGSVHKEEIKMPIAEFNTTWFISEAIAKAELTRRIVNGEMFDPALYGLEQFDILAVIKTVI